METKYKVVSPGTDIDGRIYTEEEICIAAGINPKACGALHIAMVSLHGCRFKHMANQPLDSDAKEPARVS